jgi:hypothetical protein
MDSPDFLPLISSTWSTWINGTPVYIWEQKLKKTKQALKAWAKEAFLSTKDEVQQHKQKLEEIHMEMEEKEVTQEHLDQEQNHFQKYLKALHNEEREWRMKSRALWLKAGDKNTTFFHKQAKARQHRNSIDEIKKASGEIINSFEEIKTEATSHFKTLYTQDGEDNKAQRINFMEHIPRIITDQDNQDLIKKITEEEVREVVFHFDPDKAPGPDGFTFHFYRQCWEIVKKDLLRMINYALANCKIGGATNSSFLALIPKDKNVNTFDRFRPISLCNASYKLLAKIIASRLKPLLPRIILPNQGGFVSNRQIWDNIILVQEAIHTSVTNKEKGMIIKIDMVNAFDRVNHEFLYEVLSKFGFQNPSFPGSLLASLTPGLPP